MLTCPLCEAALETRETGGWLCRCGEMIPFGFERDDDENCEACPMKDCPRRK